MLTGQPTDISHLTEYARYDWVYYWDDAAPYPVPKETLGRCLGPADNAGNAMSQWVMNRNGTVIPKQTLRPLTRTEHNGQVDQQRMKDFDDAIKSKFGDSVAIPDESELDVVEMDNINGDEDSNASKVPEVDEMPNYDQYLNAEVLLPHGEHMQTAKVIRRMKNDTGKVIGNYNDNPALDSRVYEVMFPDGVMQQYSANTIAQSLWENADPEGYQHQMLRMIVDHRHDETALRWKDIQQMKKDKKAGVCRTTKGWHLCVEWKDGTIS